MNKREAPKPRDYNTISLKAKNDEKNLRPDLHAGNKKRRTAEGPKGSGVFDVGCCCAFQYGLSNAIQGGAPAGVKDEV